MLKPRALRQNEIKLSSFLVVRIDVTGERVSRFFSLRIGSAADPFGGDREHVLEVTVNECFNFLVALDRFDVLKVDEDEVQRRQHARQAERKDEPETTV